MSNSTEEDIFICPSFSSYSTNRLAEIAGIVAAERSSAAAYGGDDDDDFEFSLVREDQEVSAEDFFRDGHIFPVFNRDLVADDGGACGGRDSNVEIPLSQLFIEEDRQRVDDPPSCSSSEADELETVPSGTYCVWRPKLAEPAMPSQCKKSKSTGSATASSRWKLRDLMRRSKSDGKDNFVFLTPKHNKSGKSSIGKSIVESTNKGKLGPGRSGSPAGSPSAHEAFYVRNKAMKDEEKRKSYLPYRQELVGFFANVNGLSSKSSF